MCQNDVKCLQTFKLRLNFLLKIVTHKENYLPHFFIMLHFNESKQIFFWSMKKKNSKFLLSSSKKSIPKNCKSGNMRR